ncbi:hypothetical protein Ocin01_07786 [Orchesella cincta]|uniref:Uncharacterized protein n=1 Tax=Orchesella cincta TaxID=48709 RepID=A0A1D2N102_ORCCI|nr:hypothetical protein Ocin01_07786 [Orchesella cincta]
MSNENGSGSPGADFYDYLRDLTWVNDDNPEGNRALLEGLHSGYTGYLEDQIIQPFSKRSGNQRTSRKQDLHSLDCQDAFDPDEERLKFLQSILYGTLVESFEPCSDPIPASKKISRPTIGEERKAWLLEARKAYCFNKLQVQPAEVLSRDEDFSDHQQPRITKYSELDRHCDDAGSGYGMNAVTDKESCTYLFQQGEGNMKPSNIRLSPRMEKLDKLIPTASKEFLNTLRIVSTISPQQSEKQLDVQTPSFNFEMRRDNDSSYEREREISNNPSQTKASENDTGSKSNVSGGGGRSYKEVFLYGPHSTTTTMIDEAPKCSRSCCRFPSLPKLKKSTGNIDGGESNSSSTPLWSSVLQRRPTSETCPDSKLRGMTSSGDAIHTMKYCPDNPVDYFTRKSRPPVVASVEKVSYLHLESPRKEFLKRDEREYQTDQESKSDSESVSTIDDTVEVNRRASGIWIEAKTKGRGRKKKSTKLVE